MGKKQEIKTVVTAVEGYARALKAFVVKTNETRKQIEEDVRSDLRVDIENLARKRLRRMRIPEVLKKGALNFSLPVSFWRCDGIEIHESVQVESCSDGMSFGFFLKIPKAVRSRYTERLREISRLKRLTEDLPRNGDLNTWRRDSFRRLFENDVETAEKVIRLVHRAQKRAQKEGKK